MYSRQEKDVFNYPLELEITKLLGREEILGEVTVEVVAIVSNILGRHGLKYGEDFSVEICLGFNEVCLYFSDEKRRNNIELMFQEMLRRRCPECKGLLKLEVRNTVGYMVCEKDPTHCTPLHRLYGKNYKASGLNGMEEIIAAIKARQTEVQPQA